MQYPFAVRVARRTTSSHGEIHLTVSEVAVLVLDEERAVSGRQTTQLPRRVRLNGGRRDFPRSGEVPSTTAGDECRPTGGEYVRAYCVRRQTVGGQEPAEGHAIRSDAYYQGRGGKILRRFPYPGSGWSYCGITVHLGL